MGKGRKYWQTLRALRSLVIGCWIAGLAIHTASAQVVSQGDSPLKGLTDDFIHYKRSAKSGPLRGEEIYFYKCWHCHNEYAKPAVAPGLEGLYKREKLLSGQPVNDQTVAEKIRNGGPAMPSYRYGLNDADVSDLVSYLRERCCYNPQNPPANPRYHNTPEPKVQTRGRNLKGGPWGFVRSAGGAALKGLRREIAGTAEGVPLEGIIVQLRRENSNITTTVYTDKQGRYEFPQFPSGLYTLRIARALEFKSYQSDSVGINGATHLEDIVLERVTDAELLPLTREIGVQLAGAEWVWNLSGTAQEKKVFSYGCGSGCHPYRQIFRNRFDEQGWRLLVNRMTHWTTTLLSSQYSSREGYVGNRVPPEEEEIIVKWLTRVRGPESKDPALQIFPGPTGPAARVIVTQYELPHLLLAPHDVTGDAEGNIWYTSHRAPYIGKLDPRTGIIEEHRVPPTPGGHPGTHGIVVDDKKGVVWASAPWTDSTVRIDIKTGKLAEFPFTIGGNMALDPEGNIWKAGGGAIVKTDPETGKHPKEYPLKKVRGAYGNEVSADGRFFAGGSWPEDFLIFLDIEKSEVVELQTRTPRAAPKKGGFDPEGNAWFGGHGGMLVKFDPKTRQLSEYRPPTPGVTFYEALPDKNGEVWAGEMNAGRFLRFNPRTGLWIEYVLPEPISHNRRTWIDNSTNPVTVWYVDHDGLLVRLEPLE